MQPPTDLSWLWQNLISDGIAAIVIGVLVAMAKKYRPQWLTPLLYGLIGMILFGAVLYSPALYARWPLWTPIILVGSLVVASTVRLSVALIERKDSSGLTAPNATRSIESAVSESARLIEIRDDLDVMRRERNTAQASLVASQTEQQATLEKLQKCESLRRLETGEVERVRLDAQSRIETAYDQHQKSVARVAELEQELRVAMGRLDALTVPDGSIRIKHVSWRGVTNQGTFAEFDLTEFFDKYIENGKLVIPKGLYRKMFPVDPLPGKPKHLAIEFMHRGQRFGVSIPENISLTLPFPYEETQEQAT